ncbi:SPOR domain-containing protein [Methyloversatilis discipulorum]|jgi:cell division septation protein DedD|uniref:SPOR domain-containing protein n=1 Tax=Methyloversatilis discipulorum TaxID=1119528 RepID=UPI003F3D2976
MRLAFLLLLLINIALWPFASGMLALGNDGAEPLRLTSQIDPERIRIVPVGGGAAAPVVAIAPVVASEPASDAEVTPAAVCRVLAGFTREQADPFVARAREAYPAVQVTESEQPGSPSWWVHIPDLATRQLADRKQAELRALGVREMALMPDADGQKFAISLGLFKTETAAKELMSSLNGQGVRSARIAMREGKAGRLRVELRGSDTELTALLAEPQATVEGVEAADCP